MACYDTSPYTCTYDSGGNGSLPGGGNPDYSSLSTWESASDNDLSGYSGPVILDCYDSQDHAESGSIAGATNTSATIYREVRSSSNCTTPWAGKKGTGANFISYTPFTTEPYCRLCSIYIEMSSNSAGTAQACTAANNSRFINVVAKCTNAGSGSGIGFYSQNVTNVLYYNCIALNCKGSGFSNSNSVEGYLTYYINCVAIGNGNYGFWLNAGTGDGTAWNCYAANNTTSDFLDDAGHNHWSSLSGWNASKDNSSDLAGKAGNNYKNGLDLITGGEIDADGLATVNTLYAAGGAGNNYGRSYLDDLSSISSFEQFLQQLNNQRGKIYTGETNGSLPTCARAECFMSPDAGDMKLSSVSVYHGSTHGAAFRLAVYQGGSLASGPAGATLLYDFGLTSTSGTNQWETLTIAGGSEPALQKNVLTWIVLKYNNNNANYILYGAVPGDFLGAGRWASASLSTDEADAYPATWPADAGSYGTSHYALKIGIIGADPAISCDTLSYKDIRGAERPSFSTADSSWNVGASQAITSSTITLTVADLTSATTLDEPVLSEQSALVTITINDLSSESALDAVSIAQLALLQTASMESATTINSVALSQKHSLVVADLTASQTLDEIALSLSTTIQPEDLTSTQTVDEITLAQGHALAVNDTTSATTLDAVTLEASAQLSPADMASATTIDAVALSQKHTIAVNDLATATTLDAVALSQEGLINVNELSSSTSLDGIILSQKHLVSINDLTSATTSDQITLAQTHTIAVADLASASTLDEPAMTVTTLEASAEDATSVSSIDAIILLQKHTLVIADLASSTTLDALGEFEEKAGITLQDMASTQTLDALTLAQKHLLSINDAVSPSTLDGNIEGTESGSINVRGATSSTSADNIDLKQFQQLLVNDLTSSTTLDATETKPIITREDAVSASTADNVTLTQWHILDPHDATSQGLIGEFTDIELAQYGYLNIGIVFSAMKPEIRFKGMKPEVEFVGRLAEARMRSKRL